MTGRFHLEHKDAVKMNYEIIPDVYVTLEIGRSSIQHLRRDYTLRTMSILSTEAPGK